MYVLHEALLVQSGADVFVTLRLLRSPVRMMCAYHMKLC